jgi:hypothetical protein
VYSIPARIKGLPRVADCKNHYKCNLRNLIFILVYSCHLPGLKVYLGSLTVKTITNAILEICLITGGFLAGLKVYLGSLIVKTITNEILEI